MTSIHSRLLEKYPQYSYPNVEQEYKNKYSKITIVCEKHGEFIKSFSEFFYSNSICNTCAFENRRGSSFFEEMRNKLLERNENKFTYPKLEEEYKNKYSKITIICPTHGEFQTTYKIHANGSPCKKCSNENKIRNYKEVIKQFIEVHKDKYDYSKVKDTYTKMRNKVTIICRNHGEFEQSASDHLAGQNCRKCYFDDLKDSFDTFLEKALKVHGNTYDYSNSKENYICSDSVISIICKVHGQFKQRAKTHTLGSGCRKCNIEIANNKELDDEKEFLQKAKEIHGTKYDYSLIQYKDYHTPIHILCKEHGEFLMTPYKHIENKTQYIKKKLLGYGCPQCDLKDGHVKKTKAYTLESFIQKAISIHGEKYDYSEVQFVNTDTYIKIKCPEHGPFWQIMLNHLKSSREGNLGSGCPNCGTTKFKETMLRKYNVTNPVHDKEMLNKILHNGLTTKDYTFPSGKTVQIQGYEDRAINELLESGINEDDIVLGDDIQCIKYTYKDKPCVYYPDIYVKSINKIIEVKSDFTFLRYKNKNLAKKQACENLGFSFEFYIYNRTGKYINEIECEELKKNIKVIE
jgi:hypothetical protein